VVSAAELPFFELHGMETPTPANPLGAKGIGESGTIGDRRRPQRGATPWRRPRRAAHARAHLASAHGERRSDGLPKDDRRKMIR
jgi:hypothetical protein